MADDGHHGEGKHDERDVAVPAVPGAGLIVVEAQLVFFFTQGSLEGHQTVQLVPFPRLLPAFCSPCLPAPVLPGLRPPYTSFLRLPAPPVCLVIYFVSFCVSFSVLSVFLCRFL